MRQARGVGHRRVARRRGQGPLGGADATARTQVLGDRRDGRRRRHCGRGRGLAELGVALRQLLDPVDRNREVEVLRIAGRAERGQPDQHALVIEQPTAAGAVRDGGRGLQQEDLVLLVAADRRQQAGAHRQVQPLRVADRVDVLPDLQAADVAQRHRRRAELGRLDLADVALRVPQLELGVDADLVVLDRHPLGLGQHMAVGDQRVGRDDDAGADRERQPVVVVGLHAPHARRHPRIDLVGRQAGRVGADGEQGQQRQGQGQAAWHRLLLSCARCGSARRLRARTCSCRCRWTTAGCRTRSAPHAAARARTSLAA